MRRTKTASSIEASESFVRYLGFMGFENPSAHQYIARYDYYSEFDDVPNQGVASHDFEYFWHLDHLDLGILDRIPPIQVPCNEHVVVKFMIPAPIEGRQYLIQF